MMRDARRTAPLALNIRRTDDLLYLATRDAPITPATAVVFRTF
jgi:hypothetical protein